MAAADTTRPVRGAPASRRSLRWIGLYLAGLAGAVAIGWTAFRLGSSLEPTAASTPASERADDLAWRFLLVVALIAAVTLATGRLVQLAGQPRVIGEILGGILLGPTAFGAVAPNLSDSLFTPPVMALVEQLALLGVVLFMLLIGFELDLRQLRRQSRLVVIVSHASIAAPFSLGLLLALVLYPRLGLDGVGFTAFALFVGLAMSVTAFPVMAAILNARGVRRSPLATTALACAAIDDVTAWCLLLAVVALVHGDGASSVAGTIALLAAFVVLMLTAGRRLLAAALRALERRENIASTLVVLLLVAALLSALATERMGLHVVFGAFLLGAVLPRAPAATDAVDRLQQVSVVCLPLFFAASGMRTDFGALFGDAGNLPLAALVLVVAIAGKLGAASLAARAMGLRWADATSIGILMNCRGLTELVVLNVGLDLGVIGPGAFTILVLMTLVTTTMTAPLLSLVRRRDAQ